jgi:dihydroorotate dehydrogenase (NAD+) catalytic subunit
VAAGASAIQVGTATFNDPTAPVRVLLELEELLEQKGFESFSQAVGAAHRRQEVYR